MLNKTLAVHAMFVLMTGSGAFAQGITSSSSLSGFYILRASGFDANDFNMAKPNTVHTGEVAVLGLVQFDGVGHFTGTLNFTSADSGDATLSPDQAACNEKITGMDGVFSVTPASTTPWQDAGPATGTLSITFDTTSKSSSGTINFNMVIANGGREIFLLQSDASLSKLTICGEPISTLVLKGLINKTYLGNIPIT